VKTLCFLLFWIWLAFRFVSDWPRGLAGSQVAVPNWSLLVSYFGLVPWLVVATPVVMSGGRLLKLSRYDIIVQAHLAFFAYQLLPYAASIAAFGAAGAIAGGYILAVSASFLFIYALGLRVGEFSAPSQLRRTTLMIKRSIGWAMAATLAIAVIQLLTGTGRDVDGVMRIYGGTSSPNVMGALLIAYFALIAPPTPGSGKAIVRPIHLIVLALFVACFSMSGFVAALIGIATYILLRAWRLGRLRLRLRWIPLLLVGGYVLASLAGQIFLMRLEELGTGENSLIWRLRTWADYYQTLQDPRILILGGGLGFDHLGMEQEPHNEFIRVWAEAGLIGFGLFLFTWFRFLKALFQVMALDEAHLQRFAAALIAASVALLSWAAMDSVLRTAPSALLLWALGGVLVGMARSYKRAIE